jgi:hypothetical protein
MPLVQAFPPARRALILLAFSVLISEATLSCGGSKDSSPPPAPPPTPAASSGATTQESAPPASQATLNVNQTPNDPSAIHVTGTVTVEPKVEMADSTHMTEFQKRRLLGHYSTIDGKTGFVLDRTVDPPRARLDGDPYVKILAVEPSVRCCVEYRAGGFWVRIDKDSGSIVQFQGAQQTDSVRVIRDADAVPLKLQ